MSETVIKLAFYMNILLTLFRSLFSHDQEPLLIYVLHWKGRLRQGVEGRTQEVKVGLCHEGDVESSHPY